MSWWCGAKHHIGMDTVLISECKITAFFCILQIFSDFFFISHVFFCFFRLSKGGRTCNRKNSYEHFCCRFSCSKEGIRTFDCYHTNFWLLSYELLTAIIRTFDCYHTITTCCLQDNNQEPLAAQHWLSWTTNKSVWDCDTLQPASDNPPLPRVRHQDTNNINNV